MTFVTRFAPSPTGPLHLGHAYSALLAHDMARAVGGEFHLRLDDLDHSRCRDEWEELIYHDLTWLGVSWDGPVIKQSARKDRYIAGLRTLAHDALLFTCTCTRRDVLSAISAPQDGEPPMGPDGVIYPGTCQENLWNASQDIDDQVLRLRIADQHTASALTYTETGIVDPQNTEHSLALTVGSPVLWRKGYAAYHLATVIDDEDMGITHIVRGADLAEATSLHVYLQRLFGYTTPIYRHHKLINDDQGKRLAKRHDAKAIRAYRDQGFTPQDIRKLVGL